MNNPDRPLIEVETEEHPEDDTLGVQVSIDLKLAVLSGILVVAVCVALLIFQR